MTLVQHPGDLQAYKAMVAAGRAAPIAPELHTEYQVCSPDGWHLNADSLEAAERMVRCGAPEARLYTRTVTDWRESHVS